MGVDEQPKQPNGDSQPLAEIAALTARVEALERQLAALHAASASAPESRLPRTAKAVPVPNFGQHPLSERPSLESRIGSQLFSRIGIIALLIGATWFLKLAMDSHWIGRLGRIAAGLIAGAAVVLWSERFRRHGFNVFSYSLKAIGTGVLYLSLWASFQLYHLLPAAVVLSAMVLVTAWNAYMAWSQNSELLAAYALAGAFATPLLLSTGGNHEVFLFTYLLAIDIVTVILARLKSWPRLLLGAFPVTAAFVAAWYVQFNSTDQLLPTTLFVTLFFITFITPALRSKAPKRSTSPIPEILLPLANAACAGLAFYSLLEDAGHHALLPWLALFFAVVYLGLMRLPQTQLASAVHLSLSIVFLTIAVPLKASGHWLTIAWLAEAAALLWTSAHLSHPSEQSAPSSTHCILRRLATGALALGLCSLLLQPAWSHHIIQTPFLNRRFATSLCGIAALAAIIRIALRSSENHPDEASPSWPAIAAGAIIALNLVAILACVREIDTIWSHATAKPEAGLQNSLAISAFLMLYGAILLAIGFWRRSAFLRWQALILLVFTIGKTFLYDMRDLTQGYRVVSFLGLGALLMAISFAYQKDWLSLRGSDEPSPESSARSTPDQPTGASR